MRTCAQNFANIFAAVVEDRRVAMEEEDTVVAAR